MMIDIIFKRKCIICDYTISSKNYPAWICKNCLNSIEYIKQIKCLRCGSPFDDKCLCKYLSSEINSVRSLFLYDGVGKELIHKWKYGGYYFIKDLFEKKLRSIDFSNYDGILAVPIFFLRKIKRGFNQANIVAKIISKRFKIKDYSHFITRVKYSLPQMKIENYDDRKKNVKNIFRLKKSFLCDNLLIVDDIITSCSTVNEIANLLRKNDFNGDIDIFTLGMAV